MIGEILFISGGILAAICAVDDLMETLEEEEKEESQK